MRIKIKVNPGTKTENIPFNLHPTISKWIDHNLKFFSPLNIFYLTIQVDPETNQLGLIIHYKESNKLKSLNQLQEELEIPSILGYFINNKIHYLTEQTHFDMDGYQIGLEAFVQPNFENHLKIKTLLLQYFGYPEPKLDQILESKLEQEPTLEQDPKPNKYTNKKPIRFLGIGGLTGYYFHILFQQNPNLNQEQSKIITDCPQIQQDITLNQINHSLVDYQSEKSLNQAEIDDINPTDILINIGRNGLTSQVIKMIQIIPSWQRIIYIGCHFEKNLI